MYYVRILFFETYSARGGGFNGGVWLNVVDVDIHSSQRSSADFYDHSILIIGISSDAASKWSHQLKQH